VCISCVSVVRASVDTQDLRSSAYCLAHSQYEFIERSDEMIRLQVFQDGASRTHERHLFVFVARTRGVYDGFDVWVRQRAGITRYEIMTNATLKYAGREVAFINPPLGGIWAQNHFKNDFRTALASPTILMRMPRALPPNAVCSSYADAKDYR